MTTVPSPSNRLKLSYIATIFALFAGTACAEPFTGNSLTLEDNQEVSYDSVTVNWVAGQSEEAGVLLNTGSQLNVAGDFNLQATGATATDQFNQQAFLVKENATFNQTGEKFLVNFSAQSENLTDQGAAYFEAGSVITLGSNAVINATGSAQTLWGVRNYGDITGDSLTVLSSNEQPMEPPSIEGFATGFWTDTSTEVTLNSANVTANSQGSIASGWMVFGNSSNEAGFANIDQLTIAANNTSDSENTFAYGLEFYQPSLSSPVNYTMTGDKLMITANAQGGTAEGILNTRENPTGSQIFIDYDQINISVQGKNHAYGVDLIGNGDDVSITASESLVVHATSAEAQSYGLNLASMALTTGATTITSNAKDMSYGAYLDNVQWTATGPTSITAQSSNSSARALRVENSADKVLFKDSLTLSAQAGGEGDSSYGIYLRKSALRVNGITQVVSYSDTGAAYGIDLSGEEASAEFGDALNITVQGGKESYGLNVVSSAVLKAQHGGTIQSDRYAVYANRGGLVGLASDENNSLTIAGDVYSNSWSGVRYSTVSVALGEGSSWVGDAHANDKASINITLADGAVWTGDALQTHSASRDDTYNGKITVSLSGGQWNLVGEQASNINTLQSDQGGTVDISKLNTDNQLTIATLKTGSGSDTAFYTDTLHNAAVVNVTALTGDGQVGVVGSAALNDSTNDKGTLVQKLTQEVNVADGVDYVRLSEGLISGEAVAVANADGTFSISQLESRNVSDLRSVNALRTRMLQRESAGLPDRLQMVRDAGAANVGGWARIYGENMRYGNTGAHSKDAAVEAGFDTAVGNWVVGGSFTYIDSDLNALELANSDGKAYVFSLYGLRSFESGAYAGAAMRYIKADTDYQFGAFDTDWTQDGFGIALEAGHRFSIADVAFVEPHASISYAHFGSDSFKSQNVKGEIDSFDALIGGVGFRAGFSFPNNKGSLYTKASVMHDFQGEADGHVRSLSGTAYSAFDEDLGDTWVDYGIGGAFRFTPNLTATVDLGRTTGGEVENSWNWGVGVRYTW